MTQALNRLGGPQPADPAAAGGGSGEAAFHQSRLAGHPADLMGYNYAASDTMYGKHL